MADRILVIGACGQIGSELTYKLRHVFGVDHVVASDISYGNLDIVNSGIFEIVDALDYTAMKICVEKHNIDTVYLLAAVLSAKGEKYPMKAWDINMTSLFNVLNLAKENYVKKIFWPSSIAVFGPTTPKQETPQHTIMEPTTVYGISKLVGERWCEYYHNKYNIDVRSLRYPGIISWKTLPGGGTTDYAVEIYHKAIIDKHYDCFLSEDTKLPMMYMEDAVKAAVDIMNSDADNIKIRSSYNLSAISFAPHELATSIKEHIEDFTISYSPDFRQRIAESWPQSIDDSCARRDWNWSHEFSLEDITTEMFKHLNEKYSNALKSN